jgi:hypothetical protein
MNNDVGGGFAPCQKFTQNVSCGGFGMIMRASRNDRLDNGFCD